MDLADQMASLQLQLIKLRAELESLTRSISPVRRTLDGFIVQPGDTVYLDPSAPYMESTLKRGFIVNSKYEIPLAYNKGDGWKDRSATQCYANLPGASHEDRQAGVPE